MHHVLALQTCYMLLCAHASLTMYRVQGTPGLTFGKAEEKMGWNAQPTCAVMMDNVRIPSACLLGEEGRGFSIAMNACKVLRAFTECSMFALRLHTSSCI